MKSINVSLLRFALPVICLLMVQLQGQPTTPAAAPAAAAGPRYYQTITYIKTLPGKNNEWLKLVRETTMKVAQMRADAGEIASWTLLRAVMPQGSENRADYMMSVVTEGIPPAPLGGTANAEIYKKAGITMTYAESSAARQSTGTMVSSEMWLLHGRLGSLAKGYYVTLNLMKVKDSTAFRAHANSVATPLAAEKIKSGAMSGWHWATRVMPSGTDQAYGAYTVDMYPTWAAAFGGQSYSELFAKALPGKNMEETMAASNKARDLAKRELWVVVERVTKTK